jgi:large subunit ribosomal protein L25
MATVLVKADMRQAGPKGLARQLRMAERIPAIVYGEGEESVPIALHGPAFEQMLRRISSGNQILDLEIAGREGAPYQVLIKDVQRNPIDQKILHVDLQHISMTHKVRVHVPIRVKGTAAGVKEGGILEHFLRELDVECLPSDIPEEFQIDVTELKRFDSVHVRDLAVPPNVHVHDAPERVIVTVAGKMKEEPLPTPAVAAGAEAAGAEADAKAKEKEAEKEPEKEKGKGKGREKG